MLQVGAFMVRRKSYNDGARAKSVAHITLYGMTRRGHLDNAFIWWASDMCCCLIMPIRIHGGHL